MNNSDFEKNTVSAENQVDVFKLVRKTEKENAALDVQAGNYARIRDVLFKDISAEFEAGALPEKMQTSPAEYDAEGGQMRPALIAVGNYAMTDMEMYRYLFTEEQLADPRRGTVENVRFENIRAYVEEGAFFPASRIVSFYEGFAFKDISLENISFNGVRAKSAEEMKLEISRVENFRFK